MPKLNEYMEIVQNGTWLEDKRRGLLARYGEKNEQSVWVCNHCEEAGVDSEEHDCEDWISDRGTM